MIVKFSFAIIICLVLDVSMLVMVESSESDQISFDGAHCVGMCKYRCTEWVI